MKFLRLVLLCLATVGLMACSRAGASGLLPVGAKAPELSAVDHHGNPYRLQDDRGRYVVVFFYPKDATPGCTKEACAFRDAWNEYEASNIRVLGVSTDDRESHEKFAREHELPFLLLVEENGAWGKGFGVKSRLGYYERVSFLIGPDGTIAKTYPNVDPAVHASEVLSDIERLRAR